MPDFRIQELMAQAVEHHRTGKLAQAEAVYRQVLELQPDFPDALNNLGAALQLSGRVDEAIAAYRQALTHQPDSPDFHYNLGMALRRKDQTEEAIDAFSQAIAHRPDWPDACLNLGYLLQADGRVAEAIAVYRQGLRFAPHRHEIRSNLLCALLLDPNQDPQTVFREHQQWNEHHAAPLQGDIRAHPNDRSSDRCLKVGYVSADFREHSVAYFIEGLLEKHDPAQVETFCYADLPALPDEFTARLRQRAHHWRDITGMADQRLAQTIREDQIDLLIDLAGHTARNRLLVFARKPAPVQVSYLGYPATTGLDGIDYYLTDAWADSAEMTQPYFTEKLMRLPGAMAPYRPPPDAPDVSPPPALAGGQITFANFNALRKLSDPVIIAWSAILNQVPSSRLLTCASGAEQPAVMERIRAAFVRHGIDPRRLEFRGLQPVSKYLESHNQVDILLDPFPVNGHTITCHALWMGVPAICLAGQTHAGRLGVTLLHSVGLTELLARDVDQYIRLAAQLASDLPRLSQLRAGMRQRLRTSALMDAVQVTRDVEQAYRMMWRKWCER
jgi:predicted O-linked N-acetylglucosamine transferase (SPINDLY family)